LLLVYLLEAVVNLCGAFYWAGRAHALGFVVQMVLFWLFFFAAWAILDAAITWLLLGCYVLEIAHKKRE